MTDTLQALIFYGFVALLILLRFDARALVRPTTTTRRPTTGAPGCVACRGMASLSR
jgi:hypothetical protein